MSCRDDEPTIHDLDFGRLCSDGGSQVAGSLRVGWCEAAAGDRLWLAASRSIAELAWMAPVLILFLEAGMWGACGANRSDGVERIQCRGSAGLLGGRTSMDVDAGSKKEKLSCEL
jgi:hypothetical protein